MNSFVKITFTICLLATIGPDAYSQRTEMFFKGKVIDARTKLPLSRATIKVVSQGIELSSGSDGAFELQLKVFSSDSLELSHLGYKTLKKSIADLRASETFLLEDYSILLRTVTVTSRKLKFNALETSLRRIKGNLFAYETELTNGLYNLFLNYLEEEGQTELFELCNYDLTNYDENAMAFYYSYTVPYKEPSNKSDTLPKNYDNYPVVNIRHEAAILFCQWLTEQYNNHPGKKKFNNIQFRLPTLQEWQIAALGSPKFQSWHVDENTVEVIIPADTISEVRKGKKSIIPVKDEIYYPWWMAYNYRKKVQNVKGCFLGNFKILEVTIPCPAQVVAFDGWTKMAQTASYFPNGFGLYDIVGNVAEMVDEKGKACGGSWNDTPEESTIRSVKHFDKPGDTIGFRIFMEVIEGR